MNIFKKLNNKNKNKPQTTQEAVDQLQESLKFLGLELSKAAKKQFEDIKKTVSKKLEK